MSKRVTLPSSLTTRALAKSLHTSQLFTLAVGTIIGSAWIIVVSDWLSQAGSIGTAIAFTLSGVMMAAIGLCYARIGSAFPAPGGEIAYAYRFLGLPAAGLVGWLLALLYIGVTAFCGITSAWMLETLFPGIQGAPLYKIGSQWIHTGHVVIAGGGSILLCYLNWLGANWTARFQDFLTYLLLTIAVIFVSASFLIGDAVNLEPRFILDRGAWDWRGFLSILAVAPFWLAGFGTIPQALSESENINEARISRVMLLVIFTATAFYSLISLGTAMLAPRPELLVMKMPVIDAFALYGTYDWMIKAILVAGLLGIVTTWNAVLFSASRVLYALGRGRLLPPVFGKVSEKGRAPAVSLIFVTILSFLLAISGRDTINVIVSAGGIILGFVFIVVATCVLSLEKARITEPGLAPAPGRKALAIISLIYAIALLAISVILPLSQTQGAFPPEVAVVSIWLVAGLLSWIAMSRKRAELPESERRRIMLGFD